MSHLPCFMKGVALTNDVWTVQLDGDGVTVAEGTWDTVRVDVGWFTTADVLKTHGGITYGVNLGTCVIATQCFPSSIMGCCCSVLRLERVFLVLCASPYLVNARKASLISCRRLCPIAWPRLAGNALNWARAKSGRSRRQMPTGMAALMVYDI
jgi:hypothetical protein